MLEESVNRKFLECFDVSGWEIESDTGWVDITHSCKTIPYEIYDIELETGVVVKCADDHIFFDKEMQEIFAKDCLGKSIQTKTGPTKVVCVTPTGISEPMYDLSVDSENHRFYTADGILQHNTAGVVAYLAHYTIFNKDKTVAVVAHKGDQAREILGRYTMALENLPMFLQPGCRTLNKGRIEFDTNTSIFSSASTSASLRGKAINILYADEFAFVENDLKFMTGTYPVITSGKTSRVIITSTANGIGNQFHKIYSESVDGKNDYANMRVDWWDVTSRDEEWKRETIANTSEEQFRQEFCLGYNSKVKILVNSKEMTVSLGELGGIIQSTSRLSADQWANDADAKILTPTGWKSFSGVQSRTVKEVRVLGLADGQEIVSSVDHPYVDLSNVNVAEDFVRRELTTLFDPIGVEGGIYFHDGGIVSHNCNEFLGSSDTLINGNSLLAMRAKNPIWSGDDGVRVYEKPIKKDVRDLKSRDATYVMTVDVCKGRGKDRSTFTIFDVSSVPFTQAAVYQNANISPMFFPDIIVKWAKAYNECMVVIESNDEGASVARSCLYDLEYENIFCESVTKASGIGVFVDKAVKRDGCSKLKDLIEGKSLDLIDEETIKEIACFVRDKSSWAASKGNHDDLVSNLWLFAWLTNAEIFKELSSGADLKKRLFEEKERALAESVPFPGFFASDSREDAIDYLIEKGYLQKGGAEEFFHVFPDQNNKNNF